MRTRFLLAATAACLSLAAPAAAQPDREPTLLARALYPATLYQPGPPSGAAVTGDLNGTTIPFPGQPIPGFSAVLDLGDGRFLGMPDNGFGSKANSADFLLRAYVVRPDFAAHAIDVERFIGLRDPDRRIPFALARPDRRLTGADFDLESVRIARDGTLWFGEEFGPFLLHTDAGGKVLEAPFPLPGVRSPQHPGLGGAAPNHPASGGFEGMALSKDGRHLYPALEKASTGADPLVREIHEFDLRRRTYTGRTWDYVVDPSVPHGLIGDLTASGPHRMIAIERDDTQGPGSVQKKLYEIDLRSNPVRKTLVADLLDVADPFGVSTPARPGEFGVGNPFTFPLQSVESVEILAPHKLLVANDNNFPGNDGRWTARDRPDDVELIVLGY